MQIHEITKRKLNEAGFAQGLAAGLSSALGKVGIAGPDASAFKSAKSSPQMNRADALKMGQKLTQRLMPIMMKNWTARVQTAMAQSKDPATGQPATSVAMLTPTSQNTLKAELDDIIGQAIQPRGGLDYNKLENFAANDAISRSQAQVVTQAIQAAADQIFKATLDPKAGINTAQAWKSLMTDGIAPAQGIIAFEAGSKGAAGGVVAPGQIDVRPTGQPYPNDFEINLGQGWVMRDPKNPQHMAALAKQAGKTP